MSMRRSPPIRWIKLIRLLKDFRRGRRDYFSYAVVR